MVLEFTNGIFRRSREVCMELIIGAVFDWKRDLLKVDLE